MAHGRHGTCGSQGWCCEGADWQCHVIKGLPDHLCPSGMHLCSCSQVPLPRNAGDDSFYRYDKRNYYESIQPRKLAPPPNNIKNEQVSETARLLPWGCFEHAQLSVSEEAGSCVESRLEFAPLVTNNPAWTVWHADCRCGSCTMPSWRR